MANMITDIVALHGSSKCTEAFIRVANDVLSSDLASIIYTDTELLFLINEELTIDAQITEETFRHWKRKIFDNDWETLPETAKAFYSLIRKYMIIQKRELFKQMQRDPQWQRWAWIIERKFIDWNIRHQVDVKGIIENKKSAVDYSPEELDEEIKRLTIATKNTGALPCTQSEILEIS